MSKITKDVIVIEDEKFILETFFVSADGKEIYTGIANPPEEYSLDSLVWSG